MFTQIILRLQFIYEFIVVNGQTNDFWISQRSVETVLR